ncbi:SDR family NAD(P)-dependent oxidoreductase [Streptomyces sp. NPDC026589]|uniref:SDR family NAD(P)-dependent oxidoreductase n=1 Tax=Streptomyces sp. NPDC026589 TaxID=3155609 RepID=UPI00340FECA6
MDNVKSFILQQLVKEQISKAEAKALLVELTKGKLHQDVAVIGLAGRFAEADGVDEFWELLKVGKSSIRDYPQLRKNDLNQVLRDPHYSELLLGRVVDEADLDKIYARTGYLERIDQFDARFFGIPPLEADYMDPHQRVALEVAYEALENAGYGGTSVKGSNTGVFLGRDYTNHSYYRMVSEENPMQLSGSWEGLVASRISYLLDLKGPCLMLDTACSAGSVSIHQAIQSLVLGECDMALAGGLNLTTLGETTAEYGAGLSLDSVMSDDAVRTFDARATGTQWAEGAGIVLLKPLNRALADRDHIRAVIKTSAINNDGASSSITAPNALMQERVILDAWAKAGIDPETISYVEAHGTGTVLGDPIEIKGLTNAFRRHTARRQFCGVGSLKTTMGHMVAASGVASLAKVVKSLETRTLAPSGNFEEPNPYINFPDSPLYVNDRLGPWEAGDGPRRAAINSFGFIRTNSHVVLEEAPEYRSEEQRQERYFFTVSAKTDAGLRELLDQYSIMLADSPWSLADICYTSNIGRGHYEHRVLVVAATKDQLAESLDRLRRRGLGSSPDQGIFYGVHAMVSEKKDAPEPGDITAKDARRLAKSANAQIADIQSDGAGVAGLGDAYIRGASIDFGPYYDGEARRRVPLPTYPYEKVRHWAKPVKTHVDGVAAVKRTHPLLGAEVSRSDSRVVFENTLSVDRHWVLSDHRIGHTSVIPGTTYLEMARAAYAAVENTQRMRFDNVFFLVPLAVQDGVGAVVQTRLVRAVSGYTFQIASQRNGEWIAHAEGRVGPVGDHQPRSLDIGASKKAAVAIEDPYPFAGDTGVFQFGPRWDSVRTVWNHEAGALALLRLQDVDAETEAFGLHPAKLDNAVNLISQDSGHTYLPYMYKHFVLHGRMPETFYTSIRVARDNGETITYDVVLVDEDGRPFAEITDYTVKKVDWESFSLQGPSRFLKVGWKPTSKSAPAPSASGNESAVWAVVVLDTTAGRQVIDAVKADGHQVVPCYLGEESDPDRDLYAPDPEGVRLLCERLLREQVKGIVFGTDFAAGAGLSHEKRRSCGVDALFELYQGLGAHRVKLPRGLKVLGKDAWPVVADDAMTDPYSAATASLALVIGQEHLPVDVVDASADGDVPHLVRELLRGEGPSLRAVRGSETYARHLTYAEAVKADELFEGGTYLITGGAGGLGLTIASEMARQGAERVLLVGRSELNEQKRKNVEAIGVAEYLPCDVSRPAAVRDLADRLRADGVRLRGIVHAAGVAGDGFLATKKRAVFDSVLAPKVDGSVALVDLAREHPGAFLVFFSSITAIMGGPGQSDYCAANAFMDSLAVRARAEGLPVLSVNWPTWTGAGMAADYGIGAHDAPFTAVSAAEGGAWLAYFLQNPAVGVIPAEFNIPVLKEQLRGLPFEIPSDVAEAAENFGTTAAEADEAPVEVRLTGLSDPSPVESRVGAIYGAVLGLAEVDAHAGFQEMGGNSLMSAQLLSRIDEAFPGKVDIADLFSYATVADLAGHISGQLGEEPDDIGQGSSDGGREAAADGGTDLALQEVLEEIGDSELFSVFGGIEAEEQL